MGEQSRLLPRPTAQKEAEANCYLRAIYRILAFTFPNSASKAGVTPMNEEN